MCLGRGFSALATLGRSLLLATHAGLFVMLAAPCLGQDAVLLYTLGEALEGGFEGFVFTDDYFGQIDLPICAREPPGFFCCRLSVSVSIALDGCQTRVGPALTLRE